MSVPFNAMFPPFAVYSSWEPAHRVAADLRARGVTHALVHHVDDTPMGRWEMFVVDDDLYTALEQRDWRRWLKPRPTVEDKLKDLLGKAQARTRVTPLTIAENLRHQDVFDVAADADMATVYYAMDGTVRGLQLARGLSLPVQRVPIYPKLACSAGTTVVPDEVVVFTATIEVRPPAGAASVFEVEFPEGADTVDVIATASSQDFEDDRSDWSQVFTLRRDRDDTVTCAPVAWEFRAKAIGERLRYALTIQFVVRGNVIGALQATLVRRDSGLKPTWDETPFLIPTDSGARCVLAVSSQANDHYDFWAYRDGKLVAKAHAQQKFEQYFEGLDTVPKSQPLRDVILGLTTDVPEVIRNFVGAAEDQGLPLLIASTTRVAPFEIMRVRLTDPDSLLGIVRPTFRWIDASMSDVRQVQIGKVAAIRPSYASRPLAAAEQEEKDLRRRYSNDRVDRFSTKPDVEGLLGRDDVRLLHFAGHADGSPAHLTLEDAKILATFFAPETKCVLQKPFFFVNGCRAGASAGIAPSSMLGNFTKALLSQGFCGAVAPSIRVDSTAAADAAKVFYDASDETSVIERVQKIRARALQTPSDALRASYLSYVVFAHAALRLQF